MKREGGGRRSSLLPEGIFFSGGGQKGKFDFMAITSAFMI
jgi:hypothetical protein